MGLKIVAPEHLRNCFVGIYDIKASDAGVSQIQRRVLERLAIARSNGITQSELAKEFGIKGNNFFYILRNLECRGLIVRHSTVLWTVEASGGRESKNSSAVTTNMLYLHRYAKHLGRQQRLEITKEGKIPVVDENGNFDSVEVDGIGAERAKEDVHVKDYLPALKAICEKLELADDKVLVVADIKRDLGYKYTSGHRAWRSILHRLKDACVVEEFCAKVNKKEVSCLRLLKSFSPKNFEPRTSQNGDDDVSAEHFGKRGQITDQLLELPIEHQIYDMIDAEGSKGLTITEVCRRLGLNNKRYYTRLLNMFSRFGMHLEAENHNKGVAYRVWTPGNFNNETSTAFYKPEKASPPNDTLKASAGDSNVWTSEVDVGDDKLQDNATEQEPPRGSLTDFSIENAADVSNAAPVESSSLALSTPHRRKSYQKYPCLTLTAASARREQWILKMLQEKKFIIRSELRRELDSLEKDKQTMTDRKTLHRVLNKLQQEGHCKCISVSAPVVTNCGRSRITEVILQASLDVTPELLGQIHERLRSFEMEIRNQGLSRLKKDQSVPILDGVQRILKNANSDVQAENSEAMRANGFVLAKMVRTKLLHIYLWNYLTGSPGWSDALSSGKHGYDLKNPHSTCKLFSLDMAIKAMPFELFLQVVGSAQKFEDMVEKCRRGLYLSDLPDDEYKRMMNTRAIGRLSWIVDVLRRLKLIRLVRDGQPEDNLTDVSHATLTYAMEVKPYIEEPVSVNAPSGGGFSFDLRPQIRHDFVLSRKEAVDAYWNTLEYSYSAADSRAALLAFPGSTVHEVFNFRSWASARVMTADQRAELRKRLTNVDPNEKITFKECKEVAKDLNLTLEQVLRVYYDKRQRRPRSEEVLDVLGKDFESHEKRAPSSRKRKKSSGGRLSTSITDGEPLNRKMCRSSDANHQFTEEQNLSSTSLGEHDGLLEPSQYESTGKATIEAESSHERDHHSLIHDCALLRMNSKRNKRFAWTENAERKLVVLYARQRAILGAKFHRIEWSSLKDLPAPPDTCKRRMAVLNSDLTFRKAMMRLCNVLGEKYAKHLDKLQSKPTSCGDSSIIARNSVFGKSCNSNTADGIGHNDELCIEEQWDNFDDENVKSALENVLRFKTKKISGSVAERANLNINAKEIDRLETSMEIDNHACGNNVHGGNSSSRRLSRKYMKLLNEGLSIGRTHESLAVSTAVELFKLIFLSTSSSPDAPNLLARTLRRYSEHDLFASFNYLREKKIMIGGTVGSPFVLSHQFLHSISSSPFPINTGKRAAKFARWVHEKEKDLIEEGMDLTTDLQCGDIFQICALVLSGEFSVSPCLPDEGVGEPEDSRIVKRKVDRNKVLKRDKAKKRKLSATEVEISNRREKGFPGIRLSLSRARISKIDALEMFKDGRINNDIGEDDQNNTYASLISIDNPFSSDLVHGEEMSIGGSSIPKTIAGTKSEWESMTSYAERLMSLSANQLVNPFHPELFKNIHSAIQKAGDQGLTMEEITQIMNTQGKDVPELVVQALEAFGRSVKVNSYDYVRVVDSLYRSKYFLTSTATFSQHVEVTLTTDSKTGNDHLNNQPDQHEDANHQQHDEDTNIGVSNDLQPDNDGMHKITILNLPKDVSPPSNEVPPVKDIEGCDQVKDTSKGINQESKASEFHPGDFELCKPILPWVNGDGTINKIVYKGLQRRVLGLLMQNPGMLEDTIIKRMSALNPQNCRELLKVMILDNDIIVRKMSESTSGDPPSILRSLLRSNFQRSKLICRKHFFANPMSTTLL